MTDLEANPDSREIPEDLFGVADAGSSRSARKKRKRMRESWSSSSSSSSDLSEDYEQIPAFGQSVEGEPKRDGDVDGAQSKGTAFVRGRNFLPNRGDVRAQFYRNYRKEADDYDKEFMKKYDEDLNTTLIFAGLFSAVTSAFIIQVHSQLQPDSSEETAALLRVLIHTMDSTALGGVVPTVPQWSGPPRPLVQVQALLYASLAASLFASFVAMLGKQWLNRYAMADMRGSTIERSQNRQRKLNGIFTWHFDFVMESLPLMLQVALLLLGCALSRYLQGIDVTVASVVLAVTTFGAIFYVFIVVAGAISRSCPYQTPGAQIIRYLWQKVLPRSCKRLLRHQWSVLHHLWEGLRHLWRVIRYLWAIIRHPSQRTLNRSAFFPTDDSTKQQPETQSGPEQTLDWEVTVLDFCCISWMLQTSLDRLVNEVTLKFLGSVLALPGFENVIIMDCLNLLISCVSVTDSDGVMVIRGSEVLAEMAATCLLRALSHTLVEHPASDILGDVYRRYKGVFSSVDNLQNLPFHHTITAIHSLVTGHSPDHFDWDGVDPSTPESPSLVHNFVKIAWHRKKLDPEGHGKVPRWILHFSFHSLLWDPEPPASVVADCLSIAAIDLGCEISQSDVMKLDKSPLLWRFVTHISSQLKWMARNTRRTIPPHRTLVATLFVWATRLEIVDEPQWLSGKSHDALRQIFDISDQIHLSDPKFAAIYADILLDRIDVNGDRVTERPGSELTVRAAAMCMLRALSFVDRKALVDDGTFDRYMKDIPRNADFEGCLCRHTMIAIHTLLLGHQDRWLDWVDYIPRSPEHVSFANALTRVTHQTGQQTIPKVPRWVLRFVLHSLSKHPPPPTSVIVACLSIIAIDLGCDVSSINNPIPNITPLEIISGIIIQKLGEMVEGPDMGSTMIRSKRKALTALFPHVVPRENEGQHEMFDAFLRAARASPRSGLMWYYIEPFLSALLDGNAPVLSKWAVILASPHIPWWQFENGGQLIELWAAAASEVDYTDEIGQSVVDTLLQIACWKSPPIPPGMWSWLNRRPYLPPVCSGRYWGSRQAVLKTVRELGDFEILTSYLLLVWSEWDFVMPRGFDDMCASIQEDFGGEEMSQHRKDLLQHLERVLRELELGLEHIRQHKPGLEEDRILLRQRQYRRLEEILLEVDKEAVDSDTPASAARQPTFMCAVPPQ